jgi:hypothetical protein
LHAAIGDVQRRFFKFGTIEFARQGFEVHQFRFVQTNFRFGAKNASYGFVDTRHGNPPGRHRVAHGLQAVASVSIDHTWSALRFKPL